MALLGGCFALLVALAIAHSHHQLAQLVAAAAPAAAMIGGAGGPTFSGPPTTFLNDTWRPTSGRALVTGSSLVVTATTTSVQAFSMQTCLIAGVDCATAFGGGGADPATFNTWAPASGAGLVTGTSLTITATTTSVQALSLAGDATFLNGALQSIGGTSVGYDTAVLADSPLLYLRFDEPSGTTATNLGTVGATANGLYRSTFTLNQTGALVGDPDTAVAVTGGADVAFNSNSFGAPLTDFTIELWVKPAASQPNSYASLFAFSSTFGFFLHGGAFTFYVSGDQLSAGAATASVYQYVVLTRTGTTAKIYKNGVLVGTGTVTGASPGYAAASSWGSDNAGEYIVGTLDEGAIYNYALDAATVLAHYQTGASTLPAGFVVRGNYPSAGDYATLTLGGAANSGAGGAQLSDDLGNPFVVDHGFFANSVTATHAVTGSSLAISGASALHSVTATTIESNEFIADTVMNSPEYDGSFFVSDAYMQAPAFHAVDGARGTCNGLNPGSIVYDAPHFYGCNGSAWLQLDN